MNNFNGVAADILSKNDIDIIFLIAHPIGSLYWSSDPTEPSELFGGEWKRIKDTFILAAGDNHTTVDDTVRGEETHRLTVSEMPSHQHDVKLSDMGNQAISAFEWVYSETSRDYSGTDLAQKTGGDQPHNNMPPYLVRNCWERIA